MHYRGMPVVIWRERESCSPTVPCQEEAQTFVPHPLKECRDGVFLRMLWKMVCRRSSTQVVAALPVSGENCCVRRYATSLLGSIRHHGFLISWDDHSLLAFHLERCGFLAHSGSSQRTRTHLALDRYPRPLHMWGLAWELLNKYRCLGSPPEVLMKLNWSSLWADIQKIWWVQCAIGVGKHWVGGWIYVKGWIREPLLVRSFLNGGKTKHITNLILEVYPDFQFFS